MQLGLVSAAPHPPPKTTTLTHANGLNPAVTNTLTFLGKERDYTAHFGVFVRIFEQVLAPQVPVLKLFSSETRASLPLRYPFPSPYHRAHARGDCK